MKNLIIASLAAAQIMDWWCIFCKSQDDITWSAFGFFYLILLSLWQADKYIARRRRMRKTSRRIESLINQPINHQRKGGCHGR